MFWVFCGGMVCLWVGCLGREEWNGKRAFCGWRSPLRLPLPTQPPPSYLTRGFLPPLGPTSPVWRVPLLDGVPPVGSTCSLHGMYLLWEG